jgi:DHA2 family multidrug resistance protein
MPLVLLAAALAYFFLPQRQGTGRGPRLDWQGLALVIAALALTLNGLADGHREGWDDTATISKLGGAVIAWAAFFLWESRHPFPILNLKLFMSPGFMLAGLVVMLTGLAVYGSTYLIPLFVQLMQHYSPTSAGYVLLPAGVAMMIGFPLAGRLSDHVDARILLSAGVAMFGVSMLLLSGVSTSVPFATMAAWIALSRFGIATLMPSAQGSAMRLVDPSMLQFAAPAMTFLTQAGGALGVASLSVLMQERAAFHIDAMAPLMTEKNIEAMAAIDALRHGFVAMNLSTHEAEIMSYRQVAAAMWQGAQVLAFRDCFYVIALAFAGLFLVIPLIPAKRAARKIRQDRPAPTRIG